MAARKVGNVTITSNFDAVIQTIQGGPAFRSISAEVWTETEYAIYVEFGTVHMTPRAMIRRSIPAIQARFEAELKKIGPLPTPIQLLAAVDRTMVFARETIQANTPVDTGALRDSYQITKAKIDL